MSDLLEESAFKISHVINEVVEAKIKQFIADSHGVDFAELLNTTAKQNTFLVFENMKLRLALEKIGGCCICPGTEDHPYGRAQMSLDAHINVNCDMFIKYQALKVKKEKQDENL